MPASLRTTDREELGRRLLVSSAKASYDPLTEIDWDTPVATDRYAMPAHRISLYGTSLWDQLTEEQRKELSRQEAASIALSGIWFEAILMQMLIRYAYHRDPTTSHIQYAYTEIADECRHSIMFGRMVRAFGLRTRRPRPLEFHALKVLGVPTQLVIYPNEGHGIRRADHRLDIQERTVAWFDKFLK